MRRWGAFGRPGADARAKSVIQGRRTGRADFGLPWSVIAQGRRSSRNDPEGGPARKRSRLPGSNPGRATGGGSLLVVPQCHHESGRNGTLALDRNPVIPHLDSAICESFPIITEERHGLNSSV